MLPADTAKKDEINKRSRGRVHVIASFLNLTMTSAQQTKPKGFAFMIEGYVHPMDFYCVF